MESPHNSTQQGQTLKTQQLISAENEKLDHTQYHHEDCCKWANPHPDSARRGGGVHAGILYTSEPLIRNDEERKYWNEIDQGVRKSNRGLSGSYQYGRRDFDFRGLSGEAQRLYRWIKEYSDRETLQWVADEEKIDMEATLTELLEKGGIENHPDRPGIIRRIIRRL